MTEGQKHFLWGGLMFQLGIGMGRLREGVEFPRVLIGTVISCLLFWLLTLLIGAVARDW